MLSPHSCCLGKRQAKPKARQAPRQYRPSRPEVRGERIRRLFTPRDARADFILYPCRSPHGGRLTNPRTCLGVRARLLRTHPSWSEHQRVRRAQMGGVEVSAGRHKSDCRSTAGEDQEVLRFVAWKGGVRCSDAVQAMAAWLARCGPVVVQRAARSHAKVSEGRRLERKSAGRCECCAPECWRHRLSRGMW